MKRDLTQFEGVEFDLVVIGGGVHGASIARQAALNGALVALIEKKDFSAETSHNSLKLIHGGVRYLQQLDIRRVRESIRERRFWLNSAPHFVKPLKMVVPVYGNGLRGRLAFKIALKLYDLLAYDRNKDGRADNSVPASCVISDVQCKIDVPLAPTFGLSAGAVWYDGQMSFADRVVLECVESAAEHGAVVANHLRVVNFVQEGNSINGVNAICELSGKHLQIRGKTVVNAAGPWLSPLTSHLGRAAVNIPQSFNMNFVVRSLSGKNAFALKSSMAADSKVGDASRLLFFTPWHGYTIIGTAHTSYNGPVEVTSQYLEQEVQRFLTEVNTALNDTPLQREDILYVYWGLTPADENNLGGSGRALKSVIIDHQEFGLDGLISVSGVKFTTARLVAEQAVGVAFSKLDRKQVVDTSKILLPGAKNYTNATIMLGEMLKQEMPEGLELSERDCLFLLELHGGGCDAVLKETLSPVGAGLPELSAGLLLHFYHAIRHEMAITLEDLLVRRSSFVPFENITIELVESACRLMADELKWSCSQEKRALQEFLDKYKIQQGCNDE